MTKTRWVAALVFLLAPGGSATLAAEAGASKTADVSKQNKTTTGKTNGKTAAQKTPEKAPAAKTFTPPASADKAPQPMRTAAEKAHDTKPAAAPPATAAKPAATAAAPQTAAPKPAAAPTPTPTAAAPKPAATTAPAATAPKPAAPTTAAPVAAPKPAAAPTPKRAPVRPHAVPFTQVQIKDSFWAKRRDTNRRVTLEHLLDSVVRSGNVRYFDLAAQHERKGLSGPLTMDAELYAAIEAVADSLATDKDERLERSADNLIAKIAAAQQPDGYLNTYYTVNAPEKRWTNLRDHHEMDNLAHLIDAGLAYFQSTGKRALLDVALKAANNLAATFGPGKRAGYPGHPGIEAALVRLSRATNDNKFVELAHHLIDTRGRKLLAPEQKPQADKYTGVEWQDDVPVREQTVMRGNIEGAINLMLGAAEIADETGDSALWKTVERAWQNAVERRTFLTGGPGSSDRKGVFTADFDLPNRTGFQGVCATAAMIDLSHRLAIARGDARYADEMELALYNVMAGAVSADGKRFFSWLPLASTGNVHRSDWFDENCAPVTAARTLAALGGYAYVTAQDAIWVNLFLQGSAQATVAGQNVKLEVTTDYPWDGNVKIVVKPASPAKFTMHVRIPAWAEGSTVTVAGAPVKTAPERGYVGMTRTWKAGDQIRVSLPMKVLHLEANPSVKEDRGRMAFQRGPIVYCLESVDSPAAPITQVAVPMDAPFQAQKRPDLSGGVWVLKGAGRTDVDEDWAGKLYRPATSLRPVPVTLVPYAVWDNRAPGAMEVWLPTSPPPTTAAETRAPLAAPKPVDKPPCPTCKK